MKETLRKLKDRLHAISRIFGVILFFWSVFFFLDFPDIVRASSLSIHVRDSEISLHADRAPLVDVLKAISDKTPLAQIKARALEELQTRFPYFVDWESF